MISALRPDVVEHATVSNKNIEIRKASAKAAVAPPATPVAPAKPAGTLPPPKAKVEPTEN